MNNKTIFLTEFGSTVYGTRVPTSDTDYKGVFIPDPQDLVLQRAASNITQNTKKSSATHRNLADDVDKEQFALHNFLKQLCDGQTFALDMIFSPETHWLVKSDIWNEIIKNREHFLHKNVKPFFSYAKKQAAKYGLKGSRLNSIKLALEMVKDWNPHFKLIEYKEEIGIMVEQINTTNPEMTNVPLARLFQSIHQTDIGLWYVEICGKQMQLTNKVIQLQDMLQNMHDRYGERSKLAFKNEGIDWKALQHAVRVGEEALELLKDKFITFPRPNAEDLLKIRKGLYPYVEVADRIENLLEEIRATELISTLPEKPNYKLAESIVFDNYCDIIIKTFI